MSRPVQTGAGPVNVLAVRWVAELALSPNGMHEIRAGAVNARERPLVGYAATYADASEIAEAHNTRAAVAELVSKVRAYEAASGKASTFGEVRDARRAMFAALAKFGGA